jgi:hypothetical protein
VRKQSITDAGEQHWEYRVINEAAIEIMVAVFPLMSGRRQAAIKEVFAKYAERTAERIEAFLFCPNGHFFDDPAPRGGTNRGIRANGRRYCRACGREAAARKALV